MSTIHTKRSLQSELSIRRALTLAIFVGLLAVGLTAGRGESQIELANEGPLPDLSGGHRLA